MVALPPGAGYPLALSVTHGKRPNPSSRAVQSFVLLLRRFPISAITLLLGWKFRAFYAGHEGDAPQPTPPHHAPEHGLMRWVCRRMSRE